MTPTRVPSWPVQLEELVDDKALSYMDNDGRVCRKDCCPVCGYQFDEVKDLNECPRGHKGEGPWPPDELISEWDDYAWCL